MTHKNNIKDLEKLSFKIEKMGGSEKLKVRINETNDDTPTKVRRLVNRCGRESM